MNLEKLLKIMDNVQQKNINAVINRNALIELRKAGFQHKEAYGSFQTYESHKQGVLLNFDYDNNTVKLINTYLVN